MVFAHSEARGRVLMLILSSLSDTGAGASSLSDTGVGASCACSWWISTIFYVEHMSIGGIRESANPFPLPAPLYPHVACGDQGRAYSDGLTGGARARGGGGCSGSDCSLRSLRVPTGENKGLQHRPYKPSRVFPQEFSPVASVPTPSAAPCFSSSSFSALSFAKS
jgi:hypothetical protein